MQLVFIITYDCNFRCKYCDVFKKKDSISLWVIKKSLDFIKKNNLNIDKVKFFWWEPLLYKDKISYLVSNFPKKENINFYLTTNSTLIDEEFIKFSKKENLNLTFSIDWDEKTNADNRILKNWTNQSKIIIKNTKTYCDIVRVNQVITSKNAKDFFENFKFIYGLWVRKFNFLPEYYTSWTKKSLVDLKEWFEKIKEFYSEWNSFELVNLDNYSDLSFFNFWIIIDTNWDLYWTNLILSWKFEKYKNILKIGSVNQWILFDIFEEKNANSYLQEINKIINIEYKKDVINSVRYIDLILNDFCNNFKNIKK